MAELETKCIGGHVISTKAIERDGVPLGIYSAYLATWDIDEGNGFFRDRFKRGAFTESIQEHKDRDNRQIRMRGQHGPSLFELIGGYPIGSVKEDDVGLFVEGEINLDTPLGASAYALAKQGVLVDLSIGFVSLEEEFDDDLDLRTISKAIIREGSMVSEPMNRAAKIIDVKSFDFDQARECLSGECQLQEKDIDEALAAIKASLTAEVECKCSGKKAIKLVDVENIENIKGVESLLRKSGFSENAAKTIIRKTKEFKSSDQREVGKGKHDDDQREAEDHDEVVTQLKDMTETMVENNILHEIQQLAKVN